MTKKNLLNCPICNSDSNHIEISDSGYSSFNTGSIKCNTCSYELKKSPCSVEPYEELISYWNENVLLDKEIENFNKEDLIIFIKMIKYKNFNLFKEIYKDKKKFELEFRPCNTCNGTGQVQIQEGFKISKHKCPTCKGNKLIKF